MKRVVLILHGWPRIDSDSLIFKNFRRNKYTIICPYLFSDTFPFDLSGITKQVKLSLQGFNPDAIVGISLGGLILPKIARNYPKTKLIFVASGVTASLQSSVFRFLL